MPKCSIRDVAASHDCSALQRECQKVIHLEIGFTSHTTAPIKQSRQASKCECDCGLIHHLQTVGLFFCAPRIAPIRPPIIAPGQLPNAAPTAAPASSPTAVSLSIGGGSTGVLVSGVKPQTLHWYVVRAPPGSSNVVLQFGQTSGKSLKAPGRKYCGRDYKSVSARSKAPDQTIYKYPIFNKWSPTESPE